MNSSNYAAFFFPSAGTLPSCFFNKRYSSLETVTDQEHFFQKSTVFAVRNSPTGIFRISVPFPSKTTSPPSQLPKPDRSSFHEGSSVKYWREHGEEITPAELRDLLEEIFADLRSSSCARSYWMYSLRRHFFFAFARQAGLIVGQATHDFRKTLPPRLFPQINTAFGQTMRVFKGDLLNIEQGAYNFPWNYNHKHRESSGLYMGITGMASFKESMKILSRFLYQDSARSTWLQGRMYKDYYSRSYHFQTDGWLSTDSARMYELNSEGMFFGGQDAMQRLVLLGVLPPLHAIGLKQRRATVVEIACGTGRFATFLRDNFAHIDLTLTDASPFYLEKARKNMRYYEMFSPMTRARSRRGKVSFVQACAEELPMADGSVDVVIAQYLFHELPPQTRRDVAKEVGRILRSGGTFVMNDSTQVEDHGSCNASFAQADEPWYESFGKEDFAALFSQTGMFQCGRMEIACVSKMMTFTRV